jgi:predicted phosphodiesterase
MKNTQVIAAASMMVLGGLPSYAQTLSRGPYLNMPNPTEMTVKWNTDVDTDSVVHYGDAPDNLNQTAVVSGTTKRHEVRLVGLNPNTKYYYSVGHGSTVLSTGADHSFITTPDVATPTRVWVIGDAGTGYPEQAAVRDAFKAYNGSGQANVWLMLGDNAYSSGSESSYQNKCFNMYPEIFRQTPVWATMGNHDGGKSNSTTMSGPYYDAFTFPMNGESGGVASGTEAYYSFDHGNIHFVCLNSHDVSKAQDGAMMTWLRNDLAQNDKDWLVVFFHHPPYSRGSHDSDKDNKLVGMRNNAVATLESYGVDLVLCGHSHSYERSMFIDGHLGKADTFDPAIHVKVAGDGRVDGDGAYTKTQLGPIANEGAVYAVAGSSGKISGGPLDHPVMQVSLNVLGSMIIDIDGDTMNGKFLDDQGGIQDYFTIEKGTSSNLWPSVSLTSPVQDSSYTAPSNVLIEADASDTDGVVTQVEFFANGASLGVVTEAPYSFTWVDAPTGDHVITAIATDDGGVSRTSTPRSIRVQYGDGIEIDFQQGTDGYAGAVDTLLNSSSANTTAMTAATLGIDGKPDRAGLFKWDISEIPVESTVTSAVLALEVSNISTGTYELYAMNRDWSDAEATWNNASALIPWEIAGAKGSTDVSSEVLGSVLGNTIGRHYIVFNEQGLEKVQEWVDNPAANFGVTLRDYSVGNGLDVRSSEYGTASVRPRLIVTYLEPLPNVAPEVMLTAPANGTHYLIGETATVTADATDSDGTVTAVDFYADGVLLGTDTEAPYSYDLTNLQEGAYVISAVATDNDGDSTTSATRTITAGAPLPVTVSLQEGTNGYVGTVDTVIEAGSPTVNASTSATLRVDGSPDRGALIRWDLSSIPAGSIISQVSITTRVSDKSSDPYEFYAMNTPWVATEATWNEASAGVSWETAGGLGSLDRDSTVLASVTWSSTGSKTVELGAEGIAKVQAWVNDPATNHGLMLMNATSSNGLSFDSSEGATVTNRPKITLTYEVQ